MPSCLSSMASFIFELDEYFRSHLYMASCKYSAKYPIASGHPWLLSLLCNIELYQSDPIPSAVSRHCVGQGTRTASQGSDWWAATVPSCRISRVPAQLVT